MLRKQLYYFNTSPLLTTLTTPIFQLWQVYQWEPCRVIESSGNAPNNGCKLHEMITISHSEALNWIVPLSFFILIITNRYNIHKIRLTYFVYEYYTILFNFNKVNFPTKFQNIFKIASIIYFYYIFIKLFFL